MSYFYRNSVLQCLFNTKQISDYFLKDRDLMRLSEGSLTHSFAQLLFSAYHKHVTTKQLSAPLTQFKNTLEKVASIFEGYAQNDAHEFYILFSEKLHDELNTAPKRDEPYSEFKPSRNVRTLHDLVF